MPMPRQSKLLLARSIYSGSSLEVLIDALIYPIHHILPLIHFKILILETLIFLDMFKLRNIFTIIVLNIGRYTGISAEIPVFYLKRYDKC